ncbi:hypothetical protein Pint_29953 [Pistacia integerrima]|uniref:Uncharacterized protein n=1 Tax=Pistacia integerrima TaxID=434235 RepID=A0ACC0WZX0_9ROSI|nr:hypothetical protein Pint_29953 [Pistacia integerrima]
MGLFSFISGTVNIPEEFADDTWPLRYKPFNHFRYLRFNSEAEPKGLPSTLKDYCGMLMRADKNFSTRLFGAKFVKFVN